MKRLQVCMVMVILFLLLCLPVHAETLKLVTGEWYPYVSEELQGGGFAAEVVQYAFLAAGIEVETEFTSWDRCEELVKEGKVFGAFPHKPTPKREAYAVFSSPIAMSKSVFFFMKEKFGQFDYEFLAELRPYRIGGARGYFYIPAFKKKGLNLDLSSNVGVAFKKLYIGKVDFVPENEFVGWALIHKHYPDEMYKFGTTRQDFSEGALHLMISRAHPDASGMMKSFNEGLVLIQKTGQYQKLLEKYIRNVKIALPRSPY